MTYCRIVWCHLSDSRHTQGGVMQAYLQIRVDMPNIPVIMVIWYKTSRQTLRHRTPCILTYLTVCLATIYINIKASFWKNLKSIEELKFSNHLGNHCLFMLKTTS